MTEKASNTFKTALKNIKAFAKITSAKFASEARANAAKIGNSESTTSFQTESTSQQHFIMDQHRHSWPDKFGLPGLQTLILPP
jgi:hypothetical protein